MTTNFSRPELKFNRYDAVVTVIVALLAIIAALWFYLPKTQGGEMMVVISAGSEETARIALADFTQTVVSHNGYTLTIEAGEDGVYVSESDCPTRDCVHTGVITRAGQSIVCLPAQVVIHLEGTASADAPDVIVG